MAESLPVTTKDRALIDSLQCGESVFSETKDADSNHCWRIYRYKDLFVVFTEKILTSPQGPILGYEVDRANLDLMFSGQKFVSTFIPQPNI